MFGAGFYRGHKRAQERTNTRRAKVFDAFQRWKADNPYATAADFQNAVRAIGGGDLTVANSLPGQQAIQRMASENQRRKAEAEEQKRFEGMERKLRYQNSLYSAVGNAINIMGDKADPATVAAQLGIPVEQVKPAFDQAKAQAQKAQADEQRRLFNDGMKYFDQLLDQGLRAGLRGEDLTNFAQGGFNEWAQGNGLNISSGNIGGNASAEQSAMDARLSRASMLSDAADEQDAATAYNALIAGTSTDAFRRQVLEDPAAAINNLIAGTQLEMNDTVTAMVREKLEASTQAIAENIRAELLEAATADATAIYDEYRAEAPNAVVDTTQIQESTRAELARRGHDQSLIDEAVATVDSNAVPGMRLEYNALHQPPDPADVINAAIANRAEQARAVVQAMTGKPNQNGQMIFAGQPYNVGTLDPALIADALADVYFETPSEAADIVNAMTQEILRIKDKEKGRTATKEDLLAVVPEQFTRFSNYIAGQQDTFLTEINDNFASTAELIETDLLRLQGTDQNYGDLDITMDGIAEASGNKAVLDQIDMALDEEIAGAQAHLAAFEAGAINLDKMTGIDPQTRLAFGQVLDRDAYAAAVRGRIVELEQRQKQVNKARVKAQPNGDQNPRTLSNPDPINSFITIGRQSFPVSVPGTKVFFTEAIEAMDTKPDAYKAFEDSLLQTLQLAAEDTKDSPGLATGAPTLYKAITGPVADERVVRGMAEALEAFDYLNALPTSSRSMTNGNTNYRQTITGLGIADDFGSSFYIDDAEKDGHAQAYALSWFMDAISGMDEETQQVLGAEFAAVLRALDRPGGNARNDLSGGLRTLDLPRFRESAF